MFFPYLFCKESNKEKKLETLPALDDYLPDKMSTEKHIIFQHWYNKNVNTYFCLKSALAEYCENDTLILLKAIIAMRKILLHITDGYDALPQSRTIAGLALTVYKKCFLKTKTIGLIPEGGYEKLDRCSDKALKLMNWIAHVRKVCVQHAGNGREYAVGPYKVDGYIESEKKVLEYLGCYYHSHPFCTTSTEQAPNGKSNSSNYEDTCRRLNKIRDMGYTVEEFWECNVDHELAKNKEMRMFFDDCEAQGWIGSLNIENFFFIY
jgi:hypothetical protein